MVSCTQCTTDVTEYIMVVASYLGSLGGGGGERRARYLLRVNVLNVSWET